MSKDKVITNDLFEKIEKKNRSAMSVYQYSVWKELKRELFSNKIALISLIILLIIITASLMAPLSPYDPDVMDAGNKFQGISAKHWFGTDAFGRDYFTRALYGGRVSLAVGFCSMLITTTVGTAIGVFSGYIGGKIDEFLMRCTDIFLALPSMLLMIVLNVFLKPGLVTLVMVLSLFSWAQVARITRAETMSLKERDFVAASKGLGGNSIRVALTHIVPNLLGAVTVSASLAIANAILMESSLSFLGLGVQIPQASWGSMLQNAQSHILDYPSLALFPGILILLTTLSFNLLGDILRTALEPKIKK